MSELFLCDVMARNWCGNIRELRAYREHAVVMSEGGVLDQPLAGSSPARAADGQVISPPAVLPSLHTVVEEAERVHIRKALNPCAGSVGKTAEVLGISRKTLWGKMKRLEISA